MLSALEPIKQQLNNFWDNLDKTKKRSLIFLILIVVIAILASVLLAKKDYVVLYSGLNEKEAAEIYTKLKNQMLSQKWMVQLNPCTKG